ncbi:hypothetical protein AUK40_06020 [Candidatus Wirthbacteria bacterium CG2_30_54_11]|uniref:Peptidase M23 domain-containing protein n=1 Tax=Candidatus Wirthbacteria bacterium CG2_30_54_11 TaxID=1817892 RepID=A0A1J5IEC5_9BACT|nr:MAG: hypothetical protein AUK40_06020 [Candidatus Wirthbacteria bacterium CG2_30_54_11]
MMTQNKKQMIKPVLLSLLAMVCMSLTLTGCGKPADQAKGPEKDFIQTQTQTQTQKDQGPADTDTSQVAKSWSEEKAEFPSTTAKYITAVPVDLSQILAISKYRSCSGHDRPGYSFEGVLEQSRSMKHYLYPVPAFQGTTDQVKLFAPFDGQVASLSLEQDKVGGRPLNGNGITFSTPVDQLVGFQFGHVYFAREFRVGDRVTAGELIGYAALGDPGFDFDTLIPVTIATL